MEPPPPQLLASHPQHFSVKRYNHRSHRGEGGGPVEMTKEPSHSDNSESSITGERRGGGEMRRATLDCNLASLCDHIQLEGFNNGVFSDVVLNAMGSTYHLHRLVLSRSSYFRYASLSSIHTFILKDYCKAVKVCMFFSSYRRKLL